MRKKLSVSAALITLCTILAWPASAQQGSPKKRIAVAKFDTIGSFSAEYGTWDIGGGLAAQLTTALIDSGQFIVVERAERATVLREQEMAKQGVVSKETAPRSARCLAPNS